MGRREAQIRNQRLNRRILRGRGVEQVKPARVGEEPERRLRRARAAEEVGERVRF